MTTGQSNLWRVWVRLAYYAALKAGRQHSTLR